MSNKPKLAIIGGGISGVCAAYLAREEFQVTLFESSARLGGNNFSSGVLSTAESPMGVILFPNENVFKHTRYFIKKFGLTLVNKQLQHNYVANNTLQYSSNYWLLQKLAKERGLFNEIKDFCYLFNRFSKEVENNMVPVGAWLNEKGCRLSQSCARNFLLMHASLYLSTPYETLFELPIGAIGDWWGKYNTPISALRQYSCIKYGSHKLIEAFARRSKANIQCKQPVQEVIRKEQTVEVITSNCIENFDCVIFATRPDEALKILQTPNQKEVEILSNIDVSNIQSTLHRNPYGCYQDTMTIQLKNTSNNKQHVHSTWEQQQFSFVETETPYYVSIHESNYPVIKEEDIIETKTFRIAIPTSRTLQSIKKIDQLNTTNKHIFYCGAYYQPSFYHEDAIQSAIATLHHCQTHRGG